MTLSVNCHNKVRSRMRYSDSILSYTWCHAVLITVSSMLYGPPVLKSLSSTTLCSRANYLLQLCQHEFISRAFDLKTFRSGQRKISLISLEYPYSHIIDYPALDCNIVLKAYFKKQKLCLLVVTTILLKSLRSFSNTRCNGHVGWRIFILENINFALC